jgi:hypothetical protein
MFLYEAGSADTYHMVTNPDPDPFAFAYYATSYPR